MKRTTLTAAAVLVFALTTAATAIGTSKDQSLAPEKNALRLRISAEPPSLNPITTDGERALEIRPYIIEALLNRDPRTNEWRNQIAKSYSHAADGLSFDFEIRPEAVWSDGQPVTADDVKFSFDVLFDERYPTAHMRPMYSGIQSVQVLGEKTVRFITAESRFTNFEAAASLPLVPHHVYGNPKTAVNFQDVIVGSGPYKLENWQRGREITLERNPLWWGWQSGEDVCARRPERIAFQFVSDEGLAFALLKTGAIDYLPLTPDLYSRAHSIETPNSKFATERVENRAIKMHFAVGFNLRRPIFQDAKVREAFNLLVDRQTLAKRFYQNTVRPAAGPWNSQSLGADPTLPAIEFNPERALQLLNEAGWADHDGDMILDREENGVRTPLKITILTWTKQMERVLTLVQNDARRIGVVIEIRMVPEATYGRLLDDGNFDMADMSGPMPLTDMDPTVLWHTKGISRDGLNFAAYSNPQVDQLIDQLRGNFDQEQRLSLLKQVYVQIAKDQPELFLFEESEVLYAYGRRLEREAPTLGYDLGVSCWHIGAPQ